MKQTACDCCGRRIREGTLYYEISAVKHNPTPELIGKKYFCGHCAEELREAVRDFGIGTYNA